MLFGNTNLVYWYLINRLATNVPDTESDPMRVFHMSCTRRRSTRIECDRCSSTYV